MVTENIQQWYKGLIPKTQAIPDRNTSITNAFANALYPLVVPASESIIEVLKALQQDYENRNLHCVYCGSKATELDHLNPIVKDKSGTGYFSEVYNLVPCCSVCNQSKGAKNWREWINSNAPKSPKSRRLTSQKRYAILDEFEKKYPATRIPIRQLVPKALLNEYEKERLDILERMKIAQEKAEEIKQIIARSLPHNT